jgi:DNA repair exonuclease SbcCD ATPase subunit
MILFKKLRWQNLLSTGNQFTEILLNKSKSTLIVGENGAGKSTILDALSFVLYGKPFRNINKPQLLNSITGKGLLVEIEFTVGSKEYMIRRGIKPGIFEVYQNGNMINQNSDVREYQDMLEKTILKMNHKSFGQIVVLGSANYVPFMQLNAGERRAVIEDLLDIQIFSVMNTLLKDKINTNKSDIRDADYQIELIEQKIEMTQKHMSSLQTNNDELVAGKDQMVESLQTQVNDAFHLIEKLNSDIQNWSNRISDADSVNDKKTKILELESTLETKIKALKKEVSFFHDHDNCPTCKQGIDHDFKETRIETRKSQLAEVEEAMSKLDGKITSINNRIAEISMVNDEITKLNRQITDCNVDIRSWNSSIETLKKEIETIKSNTTQIDNSQNEIDELKKDYGHKNKRKYDLLDQKEVLDIASSLLKDTGIKTRIIKQYVPIINKLVNKYLAALDFFVNFELDEKFNETIKSRFRDEFSYASFSEGEKMRIDLALMFTWRAIAKLRNSASTNLLIMDEVFDSSLDVGGTEEFLKILDGLTTDSNVFIISHKGDQLYDKFHSVIKFEKHKNFSRIAA